MSPTSCGSKKGRIARETTRSYVKGGETVTRRECIPIIRLGKPAPLHCICICSDSSTDVPHVLNTRNSDVYSEI
jgi:hypothetical protein